MAAHVPQRAAGAGLSAAARPGRATLRPATVDDAPAVAALIGRLSGAFLVNADGAGAQAFFESVGEAAEARYLADARYRYVVACDGDDVIGFIALRDGTHVFHLFVEPAYQGRRIASALWARVHDGSSAAFTVNASLNAVPVYEAFGFVPAGEVTEAHGVRFLPMRRVSSR